MYLERRVPKQKVDSSRSLLRRRRGRGTSPRAQGPATHDTNRRVEKRERAATSTSERSPHRSSPGALGSTPLLVLARWPASEPVQLQSIRPWELLLLPQGLRWGAVLRAGTPGAPARASSSDLGVVATRRGRALGSEARSRLEFAGGIGVLTVLREESACDGIR